MKAALESAGTNKHGKQSLSKLVFANTGGGPDVTPELQFGNLLFSAVEH